MKQFNYETFMSLLAAAAIGGLITAAGSYLASRQNAKVVESTNRHNRELADYQNRTNLEHWNIQNEYNTPAQQMSRYQAAGLNPNLIYGQQNTAGSIDPYKAPKMEPYTGINYGLAEGLESARDTYFQGKQIQNLTAQNDLIKQQTISEVSKQANTAANTANTEQQTHLSKILQDSSLEAARANIEKIKADTEFQRTNINFNDLRRELTETQISQLNVSTAKLKQDMNFDAFEQSLKRMGIYPGDKLYERIFARLLKGNELTVQNFINNSGENTIRTDKSFWGAAKQFYMPWKDN